MEVLGERWTLLVVRELLCGSRRFNDLMRGVPLMSRTMLSARLKSLERCGVVTREDGEYHLTQAGEELRPVVEAAGAWAVRWLEREPREEHLDAGLLMWDVRRNVERSALPDEPVTVQFFFPDASRGQTRFWLRMDGGEVDLCLTHPGFEVDLEVEASLRIMTMIWVGDLDLHQAVRRRQLRLTGRPKWVRAFPRWLRLSAFAAVPRNTAAPRA